MVLTEAEILEVKAEVDRVKEGSELDAEHVKVTLYIFRFFLSYMYLNFD